MTDAGILQERHPHGKILFLSYLVFSLIAFFCAVAGIFICRSAVPFGAWLFWFCVVSALSGRIFEKEIRKYVLLSYSIFSILGMMALFTYYFTYGYTFAPYGDDSYFFCNAQNIISGIENEKFEVYGVLISIPLRLIQLFTDKFQHYALLPLNWAAASFVVGFSLRLGYDLLPGRECSPVPFLAFACIVLNSIFCDAVVHLYRDVFMSLFAVLSLHSVFRDRWKSSVVFAVFSGIFRAANGLLLFLLLFLLKVRQKYAGMRKLTFFLIILFVSAVLLFILSHVSLNMSSFLQASEVKTSILETLRNRAESFTYYYENAGIPAARLQSNSVLYLFSFLFSPVRVTSWVREVHEGLIYVGHDALVYPAFRMFRIDYFVACIGMVFQIFIVPKICLFLYASLKGHNMKLFILAFSFLCYCFLIAFVSMQVRHKVFLILFLPAFLFLYEQLYRRKYLTQERCFRFGLLAVAVLVNLRDFYLNYLTVS